MCIDNVHWHSACNLFVPSQPSVFHGAFLPLLGQHFLKPFRHQRDIRCFLIDHMNWRNAHCSVSMNSKTSSHQERESSRSSKLRLFWVNSCGPGSATPSSSQFDRQCPARLYAHASALSCSCLAGESAPLASYELLQGTGEDRQEAAGRSSSQSTAMWGIRCPVGEAVEVQTLVRNESGTSLEVCLSLACHSVDAAPDWERGGDSSSVLWCGSLTGDLISPSSPQSSCCPPLKWPLRAVPLGTSGMTWCRFGPDRRHYFLLLHPCSLETGLVAELEVSLGRMIISGSKAVLQLWEISLFTAQLSS